VSDALDELTRRLEELAERLRGGGLEPAEAAAAVEECARIAGEATAELERIARAAPAAPAPGQTELI
jgi:hypothetical protein